MADKMVSRLPLGKGDLYSNTTNPMAVMPVRPDTAGSVHLTSSVTLTSPMSHDLSKLSATSLVTLQLAARVPLRTFYDGLFRFPCHYGMQLYIKAAEIFDRLKTSYEPGSKVNLVVDDTKFENNDEKKLACELAYATLKYEDVLFQTLADASFTARYPEYRDDVSLASVILYDYQERRFQRRSRLASDGQAPVRARRLEEALLLLRTRLQACLARLRILHDAVSLRTLLPADLQPREADKHRPLHGWLNNNKASTEDVLDSLWSTLKVLQPSLTVSSFRHDQDFTDLLCFEAGWKETIENTATCKNRWVVLQEKACCLPAYAAVAELRQLWTREPELRGTLLQVGAGSGRTLAHLLSLLPPQLAANLDNVSVLAGDRREVVEHQLRELGVSGGARVLSGGLHQAAGHQLRNVIAAIVTPDTTQTALLDPVEWVIEEGGEISLLRELSMEPSRSQLPQRVAALVTAQNETLLRTLRLPRVRLVVYATHSANRAENEEVVFGVVDEVNEEQRRRWHAQRERANAKLELETPPEKLYELQKLVLPSDQEQSDQQQPDQQQPDQQQSDQQQPAVTMPFLVLPQTSTSSGVFIAIIVKNVDYIRRENRSVIDTALGMGILEGFGTPLTAADYGQPATDALPSRRKLRRPKPTPFRSERTVAVSRSPDRGQRPAAAASLPANVAARQSAPLHVQVPHLQDCTCTACVRQRRRRGTPSQPVLQRAESTERSRPQRTGVSRRRRLPSLSSGGQQEGSVSSLPTDTGAARAERRQTQPQPPLSPIQASPVGGAHESPLPAAQISAASDLEPAGDAATGAAELSRRALSELAAAADAISREAVREARVQMGVQPPALRSQATLRDLRELARLRAGLLRHQPPFWWHLTSGAQPAPSLRPQVRQLLAPAGRPAARWTVTSPHHHHHQQQQQRRWRDSSQPPAAQNGSPEQQSQLRLRRIQRRQRNLSLATPLRIHKVNIGDILPIPSGLNAPVIF